MNKIKNLLILSSGFLLLVLVSCAESKSDILSDIGVTVQGETVFANILVGVDTKEIVEKSMNFYAESHPVEEGFPRYRRTHDNSFNVVEYSLDNTFHMIMFFLDSQNILDRITISPNQMKLGDVILAFGYPDKVVVGEYEIAPGIGYYLYLIYEDLGFIAVTDSFPTKDGKINSKSPIFAIYLLGPTNIYNHFYEDVLGTMMDEDEVSNYLYEWKGYGEVVQFYPKQLEITE